MRISFVDGTVRGSSCDCNTASPHACSNAPLVHNTGAVQQQYKFDCYFCDCACHAAHWTKPQNTELQQWLDAILDETFAGDSGALVFNDDEAISMMRLDNQIAQEKLDAIQDQRAGFLGRSAYHHHTEQVHQAPEHISVDVSAVLLAFFMG